jgi:hypothetical protein
MVALVTWLSASEAQAISIVGEVHFTGSAVLTGADATPGGATGIDFSNPIDVMEEVSFDDYGGLSDTTTADFTDLTFGAVGTTGALPMSLLWTFDDGGLTYEFWLTSVTTNGVIGGGSTIARVVGGQGLARIYGPGSDFDDTDGFWQVSTSGRGSTISFSSYAEAVPDGGTTMALLGLALIGLDAARRKLNS